MEKIVPLGKYVLVRPDPDKTETSGGIVLPEGTKIPVLTGIVLEIGEAAKEEYTHQVTELDKVLFRKSHTIPTDLEAYIREDKYDGLLLVPITEIVAKVERHEDSH